MTLFPEFARSCASVMKLHLAVHIMLLNKTYQRLKKVSGSRSTIVELVIIL
jgi:hypothetical protein